MISSLLQLLFAFAFIALACVLTYKITLPLCLKIIDLCFVSTRFRVGISIFLAIAFFAVGVFQLIDFVKESDVGLAWFFPLSFLVSGLFLFLAFKKPKIHVDYHELDTKSGISKLKLKDIEKWKNLNKPNLFSYYDYIFHELTAKNVNSDIYFSFLELFWPTFIKHENYIFLQENFSESKFETLKKQDEKIEFWMNFLSLDPYFERDEDQDDRAEFLANSLVEIWQTKLKNDFPHLKFAVLSLKDIDAGDYGITFYQQH